ncbi:MAG TPA: GNAT family N-acetyltransferase [Acidobacteriaceae bacterium]
MIRIEALTEFEQFDQCVALQDAVWGYEAADRMTQKVYLLASRIGGQVIGAYDGETLAGYAMSLPGVRNGHAYLHSHHLGVLAEYRNAGVGRRLKLAQRDDALARGFELMEWTFDPLEIKNAHLNVAKLGAVIRRYRHDFYGPSSSPLQGGLPTDRVYAEWWLKSKRVEGMLAGQAPVIDAQAFVDVPAEIYAWKASPEHRDQARAVQQRNAEAFEAAFARGLSVLGYERSDNGDGRFVLGVWDEELVY